MRNWVLLFSVALAGGVIGAWLSSHIGNVINMQSWDAGWVQAIGSILAVAVAIYVPWKIDSDKKKSEKLRSAELRVLSLKALGHEAWLMKNFFMQSRFAISKGDQAALEDFSEEAAPVDPKSPFVMEHGKFEMVAKLPDEIATAYMNALSRRFLAINYMRSHLWSLKRSDASGDFSKGMALLASTEGEALCDEILEVTKAECAGLRFGLRPGGYEQN